MSLDNNVIFPTHRSQKKTKFITWLERSLNGGFQDSEPLTQEHKDLIKVLNEAGSVESRVGKAKEYIEETFSDMNDDPFLFGDLVFCSCKLVEGA